MLKKLVTSAFAGALAAVLAAPVAMACPGHDSTVADKDEKADGAKTADKTKAKKDTAKPDWMEKGISYNDREKEKEKFITVYSEQK